MKLCRSLAVAAAVAVTAPLALLTAAPALAAGTPAGQTQNQPTYAELVKAAADAKTAHEKAVIAQKKGLEELRSTLDELASDTHPLMAAATAAEQAAEEAAGARTAAEKAVADAETALEAAQSDEEKTEAQKALEAAETELEKAVEAKKKADTAAEEAFTAWNDARVAATRAYSALQEAVEKALDNMTAAEEALTTAGECVRENGLTSLVAGLPSEVVAGTTVDLTLSVTNGTERTLSVDPLVFFPADGEGSAKKNRLKVEWSNGSGWQTLSGSKPEHIAHIDTLKPGEQSDVKLRLTADSVIRATDTFALVAADASDAYNPCVLGPMKRYDFTLLPEGSTTDPADEAEPVQPGENDDKRPDTAQPGTDPSPQGGTSRTATSTGIGTTGTTGSLAATGTSPALTPLGLASAVTVALGAGAVVVARRRRSADNI